ncbi:class I SAM-dependent methyltransferase [bacterium]|nr:class I SAM-dependent methyltransferase [bacterium]
MSKQPTNYWDIIFEQYVDSVKQDKTSIFAYEKNVNTPSILSLCPNGISNALDLGCGDGRFTNDLANIYPNVMGIDNSNKMLRYARKTYPNATFVKHNLEDTFPQFSGTFELITAKLTLMYIKDLDKLIRQCFNIISPKGNFIVSVTHPAKWLTEKHQGLLKFQQYKGYLSEITIEGNIAHNDNLTVPFINRTFQTYVNSFTKHGFTLKAILETGVPDAFVIKYPQFINSQTTPYRLNMNFIKP